MVSALPAGTRLLAESVSPYSDAINTLLDPPRARYRQSVAQSVTTAVFAVVTFTTEDFDSHGGHSTSSNTGRYTAPIDGLYQFTGKIAWASNATGQRASVWQVNGDGGRPGTQVAYPAVAAVERQYPAHTFHVELEAGDYVELLAYQDSGGNLSTSVTNTFIQSCVSVLWVAELI